MTDENLPDHNLTDSNYRVKPYSELWWANKTDGAQRCVAHTPRGRCLRPGAFGGTTCRNHGGTAPQVLAKAREAMQLSAFHNYLNTQGLADSAENEQVRLNANKDLLDRAGLSAKTAVEIEVGPKPQEPWEQLFGDVMHETKAHYEARKRGEVPPAPAASALPPTDREILDAEVVDEPPARTPSATSPGPAAADRSDGPGSQPAWGEDPPEPPNRGLMTMEEANAALREDERRAKAARLGAPGADAPRPTRVARARRRRG